jgi:flavin-dependent dehydrogenase
MWHSAVDDEILAVMTGTYDAIVIGARCAGSPTAMQLARKGYRVLLVDRATFPSDAVSTHFIHVPGAVALHRWGLLDRLAATGCPAVDTYSLGFGPFTIAGSPRPMDGLSHGYGPRRTVLDELLVEAASEAGAEVRQGFVVDDLLADDGQVVGMRGRAIHGGELVEERAPVVIGADGRHSLVASAVRAPRYEDRGTLQAFYYAYWSGVPIDSFDVVIRPHRSFGTIPTHDNLTCVFASWPIAEFEANRDCLEDAIGRTLELSPAFAERIRAGTRETRFVGTGDIPNVFRQPYGPGWALVGDAGYHKDPCTAHGITDAFLQSELLVEAIDQWQTTGRPYAESLSEYQRKRDTAARPMFELTCQIASLEPPPPDMAELLAACSRSQAAMDDFISMMVGTLAVAEFFAPEHVKRILGADSMGEKAV